MINKTFLNVHTVNCYLSRLRDLRLEHLEKERELAGFQEKNVDAKLLSQKCATNDGGRAPPGLGAIEARRKKRSLSVWALWQLKRSICKLWTPKLAFELATQARTLQSLESSV